MSIPDTKIGFWETRWSEGNIGWHREEIDRYLIKYYPNVTGKPLPALPISKDCEEFRSNSLKTWLDPLTGKTLDVPFLLSLGYKVFGIEGVRQAIDDLNQENNLGLELDVEKSTFVGAEGRLKIYFGDLFKCPVEEFGPFDYVWDRGSLIALEYPLREAYIQFIQRALKDRKENEKYHGFSYLLEVVEYDKTKFEGPPRSFDVGDLDSLYNHWTSAKMLERNKLPDDHRIAKRVCGVVEEVVYLIMPK